MANHKDVMPGKLVAICLSPVQKHYALGVIFQLCKGSDGVMCDTWLVEIYDKKESYTLYYTTDTLVGMIETVDEYKKILGL